MCFSATVSFATAGFTGAIAIACFTRVRNWRELPLAAMPLIFAGQQAVEGSLWLTLPTASDSAVSSMLTLLFLLHAKVFWPVFAPTAVLLIEPKSRWRWMMATGAVIGAVLATYFLLTIYNYPHTAIISAGHIVYNVEPPVPIAIGILYLMATAVTSLLSSYRAVILLGAIVFAGSLSSYFLYWEAYTSVWCFFAAAGSVVIFSYFQQTPWKASQCPRPQGNPTLPQV
jgi:hypothetical protein